MGVSATLSIFLWVSLLFFSSLLFLLARSEMAVESRSDGYVALFFPMGVSVKNKVV